MNNNILLNIKNVILDALLKNTLITSKTAIKIIVNEEIEGFVVRLLELNQNEHIEFSLDNDKNIVIKYIVDIFDKNNFDILFKKTFKIKDEDIDFLVNDIIECVYSIVKKMYEEYIAADRLNSNRLTTKISVLKYKQFQINSINNDIQNLKKPIEKELLDNISSKYKINDVIVMKENCRNVCIKEGKKYYINKLSINYDEILTPFVSCEVGRINPDGSLNASIISSDNYFPIPVSDFNVITNNIKEKFANTIDSMYKERTTIIYNKGYDIIDNKVFRHNINSLYSTEFNSNFHSRFFNASKKISKNDFKYDYPFIKLYHMVEFKYKGNIYLYPCFDRKNQKFLANKKSIEDLVKLIKNKSPLLIKMPDVYKEGDFVNTCSINGKYGAFLLYKLIEQFKLFKSVKNNN